MSGAYNLTPYNRSEDMVSKDRKVTFFGSLSGFAGSATIVHRRITYKAALNSSCALLRAFLRTIKFSGTLNMAAPMILALARLRKFEGDLRGQAAVNTIKTPRRDFVGSLSGRTALNRLQDRKITQRVALDGMSNLSVHTNRQSLYFGALEAFIDVMSVTIEKAEITVIIPAGSKLVIDTGRFTAYLDGKNVVDRYEGAWPLLSPDMAQFQIEVGEGSDIQGEVFYREVYL